MYDWDDLRHFLAVHREGSLSGAARKLRADPTTVSRRLTALEDQLGARLFVRGRDRWTLTPAGARMVPAAEQAEDAAHAVQRAVAETEEVPSGRVRLTMIEILAARWVTPVLPELLARYPKLEIDLTCTTRVLDLQRGEADLAVRIGRPTEPDLLARRVATMSERVYVAASWLERRGLRAEDVRDLDGRDVLLLFTDHWHEGLGATRPVLRTSSPAVARTACLAGLGATMMPDVLAAGDPRLVPLDGLGVVGERPLWLVVHRDLAQVARVRAVADFLYDRLVALDAAP